MRIKQFSQHVVRIKALKCLRAAVVMVRVFYHLLIPGYLADQVLSNLSAQLLPRHESKIVTSLYLDFVKCDCEE